MPISSEILAQLMTEIDPNKRYKSNPFVENLKVKGRKKAVQVAPIGKNASIINHETGEVSGTHVVTHKTVDSAMFVKLFTDNIKLTFGLTASGTKTLNVLMWEVQRNGYNRTDMMLNVYTLHAFLEANGDCQGLSERTFKRGLTELCRSGILARHLQPGHFHLNPNFIFNGDRIAFTTLIERENNYEGLVERSS